MNEWIIIAIGFIVFVGMLAFYFFVFHDIILFRKRVGSVVGKYYKMNVRAKGVSEIAQKRFMESEHAFSRLVVERVMWLSVQDEIDLVSFSHVVRNTDIVLYDDEWCKIKGYAEREWCWRKFGKRCIVYINVGHPEVERFSGHTMAKLVLHEMIHNYLWKTTGDGYGKYSVGDINNPEHNHPIWEKLGI